MVASYFEMLVAEVAGGEYSKTDFRNRLRAQLPAGATRQSSSSIGRRRHGRAGPDVHPRVQARCQLSGGAVRWSGSDARIGPISRRADYAEPADRLIEAPSATAQTVSVEAAAPPCHVDYDALRKEQARVGQLGEKLVVAWERVARGQGCADLASQVRWVSVEDGDGAGFDALSFRSDGASVYIEVKSTTYGDGTPFYLSAAELDFARDPPMSAPMRFTGSTTSLIVPFLLRARGHVESQIDLARDDLPGDGRSVSRGPHHVSRHTYPASRCRDPRRPRRPIHAPRRGQPSSPPCGKGAVDPAVSGHVCLQLWRPIIAVALWDDLVQWAAMPRSSRRRTQQPGAG